MLHLGAGLMRLAGVNRAGGAGVARRVPSIAKASSLLQGTQPGVKEWTTPPTDAKLGSY